MGFAGYVGVVQRPVGFGVNFLLQGTFKIGNRLSFFTQLSITHLPVVISIKVARILFDHLTKIGV